MLALRIQRIFVLLGFVALIFSFGAAPAAFAMEPPVSFAADGITDGQAAYMSGDTNRVPADGGKGCPYRHCVCHAHYVAATLPQRLEAAPPSNAVAHATMRTPLHAGTCNGPALRPPQA